MTTANQVWQLHREHPDWGLTEMAAHFGTSKPNICNIAKRASIELPKRSTRREAVAGRRKRVLELYAAGVPLKEIAAEVGVSKPYISQLAHRRGLRRNGPYLMRSADMPPWVPASLRPIYKQIARATDEETAAHHCRLLKNETRSAA